MLCCCTVDVETDGQQRYDRVYHCQGQRQEQPDVHRRHSSVVIAELQLEDGYPPYIGSEWELAASVRSEGTGLGMCGMLAE